MHRHFSLCLDVTQEAEFYTQLDERDAWFYEALTTSAGMTTKTPGVGSVYLGTYKDKDGSWLDGANMAGSVRVTPGVGDAVTISAGDAWLMEDTTGSGHTTEVISQGPFEAVVIQLPDDAPLVRP